jgi:DNA-binding XRE family transcriptional regulator
MQTKSKYRAVSRKKPAIRVTDIRGLHGVRLISYEDDSKLELRNTLGMAREAFGRLVNVSVRTIAAVESTKKKARKLQRNYIEVKRLCDALGEVVDPSSLGEWFHIPNDAFDGSKPIEVIERGEIDRLWEMSYRLRSGMPA